MSNIKRDQNRVTLGAAVSTADSTVILPLIMDSITNGLMAVASNDAIVATVATDVKRDGNHKPTYYGISWTDGETLVPIRTDDNGYLLAAF